MKHAEFIQPWQARGRWYKVFIESTGQSHKLTHSDLDSVTISGSTVSASADFKVIDVRITDHDLQNTAGIGAYLARVASNNRSIIISLPTASNYTYVEAWIFGYYQEPTQVAMAKTMSLSMEEPVEVEPEKVKLDK